jgi:hypothetical protein
VVRRQVQESKRAKAPSTIEGRGTSSKTEKKCAYLNPKSDSSSYKLEAECINRSGP